METPNEPEHRPLVCRINLPDAKLPRTPHTKTEMRKAANTARVSRIAREFKKGFEFISDYPKSVTIYGSARFKENNPHYKHARELGSRLAQLGYAVATGGGPGIMEAGNRGAMEAGGVSLGLNIRLPREQVINPYVTKHEEFYYFFSRKTALSFAAETYIYYPGGFGTLDEFFEIVTLVQTKKIPRVPIVLVGVDFWTPLRTFMMEHIYLRHRAIDKVDLDLFTITDDIDKILEIVQCAPERDE